MGNDAFGDLFANACHMRQQCGTGSIYIYAHLVDDRLNHAV